jgi:thiamine biosynthesis lipoprotein
MGKVLFQIGTQERGKKGVFSGSAVFLPLVFSIVICACCTACARPFPSQSEFVLGTVCTVNLYKGGTRQLYRQIFARLREIEGLMSVTLPDSEIAAVNRHAGNTPVLVGPATLEVIAAARRYASLSGGAFDPTIGPLVSLWGIGSDSGRLPEDREIQEVLPLVNWEDLLIDHEAGTVFLRRPDMRLDLGAIAKGYAADEAVRIIRQDRRVKGAIVDLGGNIFAYGERDGNLPWRIGVQNPLEERGAYLGTLEVKNKTVVTSGVYERFLELDGKRYHHILSTRDGYPVSNGILSVTVIADRSIDADALSTTIFTLGWEKGIPLAESLNNVEALCVLEDMTIRGTSGVFGIFTLSDPLFKLIR